MAANNPSRGDYNGDPERLWQAILHTAEVSRRWWVQGTRRQSAKHARISVLLLTISRRVAVAADRDPPAVSLTELR